MSVDADQFRDVLRCFAAGVTIVTASAGERRHGMTVSAFSSVSADPPLIAVNIERSHTITPILRDPDCRFAVSILGAEQVELSNRFAFEKDEDRFLAGSWRDEDGVPVLADAVAWMVCRPHAGVEAGSHTIWVGRVKRCAALRPEDGPLVYWNRGYQGLRAL